MAGMLGKVIMIVKSNLNLGPETNYGRNGRKGNVYSPRQPEIESWITIGT
jgi:hypothetical protein